MMVLVVLCLAAAMVPRTVTSWMSTVIEQNAGLKAGQTEAQLATSGISLSIVGQINFVTLIAIAVGLMALIARLRQSSYEVAPTWGCGYASPTPRMQYTGRSFTEILSERLLPRAIRLRPVKRVPTGLFPLETEFATETTDPVNEKIYEPFFHRWGDWFTRLRVFQRGQVHIYLLYIALMVVLAMSWASLRRWWGTL